MISHRAVHALNQNPVKLIGRTDLPRFINVGIEKVWDKISTYEVYEKHGWMKVEGGYEYYVKINIGE